MRISGRVGAAVVIATVGVAAVAVAGGDSIELASVNGKGKPLDRRAGLTSISADGRYVSFTIDLGLQPGDTTAESDVWVYDSKRGRAERVSGSATDRSGSFDSSISANGRYVAFVSDSDRLVNEKTDNHAFTRPDVFVYDRKRGRTELISHDAGKGGRDSFSPVISGDGRFVAFASNSENLIKGESGGKSFNVYAYDRRTDKLERVSTTPAGDLPDGSSFEPAISADGDRIAFYSSARNLVEGYVKGRASTYNHLSRTDVYVYDRSSKKTDLVSVTPEGKAGKGSSVAPAISADGSRIAFGSAADNLVAADPNGSTADIFVRDLDEDVTTLVSLAPAGAGADGTSFHADISADGQHVAYASKAKNLVAGDDNGASDVFITELATAATRLVSDAGDGPGGDFADNPAVSADGRLVAFASAADDLAAEDGKKADVFLRDLGTAP